MTSPAAPAAPAAPVDPVAELAAIIESVRSLPIAAGSAGRIEQIRLLEELSGSVAAAQAGVTVAFVESRTVEVTAALEAQAAAGSDDPGVRSARGRARRRRRMWRGRSGWRNGSRRRSPAAM